MNLLNIFLSLFFVCVLGIYIYVAIDIPRRKFSCEKEKKNWLLLIFFSSNFGLNLLFDTEKEKKERTFLKKKLPYMALLGGIFLLLLIIPSVCKILNVFEESSDTQLFDNNTSLHHDSLTLFDIRKSRDTVIRFKGVQVLNFWASWCKPCLEEIPSLEQLQSNYHGINFFLLSFDDTANLKKAIQKYKINLPAYFVIDTSVFKVPKILPRTIVLRNDTVIRDMYVSRNWLSKEMRLMFDSLAKN